MQLNKYTKSSTDETSLPFFSQNEKRDEKAMEAGLWSWAKEGEGESKGAREGRRGDRRTERGEGNKGRAGEGAGGGWG